MAEKKIVGIKNCPVPQGAAEDFETAQVFDKLRVGKLGVYYKDGFKIRIAPYDYVERVFIRIQEVNGRMCCGNTTFAYFRLVFVHGGKEVADVISEKEEAMDAALERIRELAPHVAIGFTAKEGA